MQQIIYFFQKFKYFLFFLMLQFIALALTFNNLNFQKSKFVNSANAVTGGFYNQRANIAGYFNLKSVNKALLEENRLLRTQLLQNKFHNLYVDSLVVDSSRYLQKYTYTSAKIINNNYSNRFNFLTLNKGENHGLEKDMAVVNGKGIIGITDNTSANYTRVQSILNTNSKLNARLKNSKYFGSLSWNGKDYNVVQLIDIPRQAPIKIGDTIETGGKSAIFPGGILIGKVIKTNLSKTVNNSIDIKLFNDMSNLNYVYVVKNLHKIEIETLETPKDE
ncbi:rod shape-determining protein MreC [uncultured Polaribacter sp.]|uniref:rod shape-determining protein MreC n=1 Tax=uncultured Polaribacter sp. TaxID=174711 RepID=UPI00260E861F|nr:rod shape-determining protein MreC [uncultured Polaribacter sp.]